MSFLEKKKLAILGGTGTLGRAIVHKICLSYPDVDEILIFSRDEIKQLEMMEDFRISHLPFINYKLGDVRDYERLVEVLEGMNYVIHAAAIKHVVMAENNPGECWKTNVEGTKNVIDACNKQSIERAVLISSDKAFNPAGVYGKSKQKAEELWGIANNGNEVQFGLVRLGNIIGARGSVFEAFGRQRKNGIIRVTHPEATRFCISQKKAATFVVNALNSNEQMLVPEMDSFNVMDLAKKIAPKCKIEIVGLRPGDKLHEELADGSSEVRSRTLNFN